MNRFEIGVLVATLVVIALFAGYAIGYNNVETIVTIETEYVTEYVVVESEPKTVFVDKIVEVEKVVEVTPELRYFSSVDLMRVWLAMDTTNLNVYSYPDYDCEDFALELQENALDEGWIINIFPIQLEDSWDMVAMVYIGNEMWQIEPQTDEIIFRGYLDIVTD